MTRQLRFPWRELDVLLDLETIRAESVAADLDASDECALALRDHRRVLGLSQRAYAERRGWSKGLTARLEAHPADVTLGTLIDALAGTGYRLGVLREGHAEVFAETSWPVSDLVARDGAGRRLPAHLDAVPIAMPHTWWFTRNGYAEREPRWTWSRWRRWPEGSTTGA